MGLQYVHKALSSDELICILRIRSLLIDDNEQAKDILEKVSFFVLQVIGVISKQIQIPTNLLKVVVLVI